ncbi:MAG TPA: SRPBCC domain-containing protein [Puia sp.]|nr:SRPBCC domain-containing protein [Puia sp.]
MTKTSTAENNIAQRTLSITRTLNAPRSLVWKVFTQPDHIKMWWGPQGFTNTIHRMEVQKGGHWSLPCTGQTEPIIKTKFNILN